MSDEIPTTIGTAFKQALVDAHHETIDHAHGKAAEARTATMETWEQELAQTIRDLRVIDFDDPNIPEPVRRLFAPINKPQNQTDFFFALMMAAGLIFTGGAAAAAGLLQTLSNKSLRDYGDLYPDPETAAVMWARGIINDTDANDWMSNAGMRDYRRAATMEAAKAPLPPATVLELVRRKIMTDDEARAMLRLNGLTPMSVNQLMLTITGSPDLGMAIAARTQSQIDNTQFVELLVENGINPKWADVIFRTAGASPSVQETLELWNRGLIDEATVDKIILESPIKNEYVPVLKLMRHRFPALEQTTTLMRRGIMTLEEGKDAIRKLGYTPELADKMATYASTSQSGSARNLTVGQMTRLFEMGRWDAGTFTTRLVAAGFDPDEAADIVDIAEEGKAVARIERGANSIGTRYVSWKIDRQEAVTLLDRINVPTATRDEMLEVWDARREAQTLHLTEAFLHKAHKAGAISREDVERRLLAMGYDAVDTAIIMATDFPAAKITAKQRDLTRADHVKRYEQGLITVNELRDALAALGYDADEVNQIIELSDKKLSDKAAKETASNGA